jgi:hypothetical protein
VDAQPTAGAVTDDSLTRPGERPAPNPTDPDPTGPKTAAPPAAAGTADVQALRAAAPAGAGAWGGPYAPAPVPPAPRSLVRRLLTPVAVLGGVVAAFGYVGAVDPNEPGHYPVCPLLRFTGVYCPGCGGLRSAHAVAHGDLPAALGDNALAVVGYGIFAVVMAVWLIRAVRGVPMRLTISLRLSWAIGAVLVLFTLVRNLPFGSALAP